MNTQSPKRGAAEVLADITDDEIELNLAARRSEIEAKLAAARASIARGDVVEIESIEQFLREVRAASR